MNRRDFLRMAGTGVAVAAAPAVILAPTRRFWPGADLVSPETMTVQGTITSVTIAGREYQVTGGTELPVFNSWNEIDSLAKMFGVYRMPGENDHDLQLRALTLIGDGFPTSAHQNDRHGRA